MDKLPFPLLTALVVFMHSWTMANCYMWDHLSRKYQSRSEDNVFLLRLSVTIKVFLFQAVAVRCPVRCLPSVDFNRVSISAMC